MKAKTFITSSIAAITAAISTHPALAQDTTSTEGGVIVVTGSIITRSDANSPSPISIVGAQEITEAGTLNITEVLKEDPSLGVTSRSNTNVLNGAGASGVDMRNLGNRRTLALVNGRRMPLFADALGTAFQDTTIIPSNLLERVDILRDGASTTYGADAVAGVVNFILREKYDGLQVEGYTGISNRGDAFAYRISALAGHTWDRGSILFSALYSDQDAPLLSDRDWAHPAIQSIGAVGSSNVVGSNNTPGGTILSASGQVLECFPFSVGVIPHPSGCDWYDSAYETSLINDITLRNVGFVGRYELTDNVRVFADVFQSRRESSNEISATQILTSTLTGIYPTGFRISAASAGNPYSQDINLRWRPSDYGSRPTFAVSNQFYANVGLDGSLADDRIHWTVSHTFSSSEAATRRPNDIDSVALYNLLNSQACAADIICAGVGTIGNIRDLLSGATPLTQAQQDYLFYDLVSDNKFTSAQTIATLSARLFTLPGGDVNAAVGFEHRKETGRLTPDEKTQSGVGIGTFIFPTDGRFHTNEVFGELDLPFLADVPLAEELTLNLQGRYSDFSNFGGAFTYKIGMNYAPVEGLRFRASYGTSFRAPDVLELYGGGVGRRTALNDPCNGTAGGQRATNAQVDANCDALGVPENYFQPDNSLPNRDGGNSALRPEKGRTFTVGAVLQPAFLPGFTATVDYYDIKITDAISAGNVQLNLSNCYASPNLAARSADPADVCFSFGNRLPNGDLDRVLTRAFNVAEQSTSGFDLNLNYERPELGFMPGGFSARLRLSHVESFKNQGVELAGTFSGGVDGRDTYPNWRGNLTTTYSLSNVDIQWKINYVDGVRDLTYGTTTPRDNIMNYSGPPTYFSHDLLIRWSAADDLHLSIGINNVFDKDPPYARVSTRNASSVLHDNMGRYFFMTVSKEF